MPRTIRFHLDEHCDRAIATGLRQRGVAVTTTPDAGLLGADDEDHIAFAVAEGRVVLTKDADFLRLHAAGVEHLGIVYVPPGQVSLGQMIRGLILIWEVYEPEDMIGHVERL